MNRNGGASHGASAMSERPQVALIEVALIERLIGLGPFLAVKTEMNEVFLKVLASQIPYQ